MKVFQNIIKKFFLFSILLVTLACGNVKRVDTHEVKARMEEYKIKKISEPTLVEWANEEGEKVSAFFAQNPNLECQDNYKLKGVNVTMVDFESQNLKHENPVVKQLLEAYQYSFENQQNPGSNLQKINDSTYVFSFPIPENTLINKKCKKQLALAFLSKSSLIKSHVSEK